jgi:hypothetical protein
MIPLNLFADAPEDRPVIDPNPPRCIECDALVDDDGYCIDPEGCCFFCSPGN